MVLAGVRCDFRPIQTHLAQLHHPQFVGHQQDLHEQPLELRQKPLAEGVKAIVIRMQAPSEVQHGNQFVSGPLDLSAGENPLGIAVEQQRQQPLRRIRGAAAPAVGRFDLARIQGFYHLHDEMGQVVAIEPSLQVPR